MKVKVINQFSPNSGKYGEADEAAWERNDFWITVFINGVRHFIAKRDMVEA